MSLAVDENRRRGRSKSPGRREVEDRMDSYRETEQRQDRERERERERASRYYDDRDDDDRGARSRRAGANSDTRESSYAYPEDDLDDFPRRRREDARRDDDYRSPVNPRDSSGALPYPPAGGDSRALTMPGAYDFKDDDRPSRSEYRTVSPPADSPYRSSKDKVDPGRDSRVRYSHYRDEERPSRAGKAPEFAADEQFKFLPQKYSKSVQKTEPPRDDRRYDERRRRRDDSDSESDDSYDDDDDDDDDPRSQQRFNRGYEDARRRHDAEQEDRRRQTRDGGEPERRHRFQMRGPSPPSDKPKKKAQLEDDLAYGKMAGEEPSIRQTAQQAAKSFSKTEQDLLSKFGYSGHGSGYPPEKKTARFDPADDPRRSSSNVLTVEPGDRRRGDRDRSPAPPTNKMSSLSVNTGHHSFNMSLGAAPPSPLQEAYHGTYQSCSPMPSPLMLPNHGGNEIVEVTPLSLSDEDARINRRARFHVPEVVAEKMAKALKGDRRSPDTEILIQILPGLSHEEVMELRTQYKTLVKAGSERKGVNVAKHIRSRLKDEDPNLMKACYATALGRWESEAYWANYWYQGDKTRRELLIESLMGRSNGEMRMIKDGFSDKKYNDSLTKCMKTELREDKFKKAVILALGEERMEDVDEYGRPLEVNMRLVSQDVEDLRRSVKSEKGGETLMISIVVLRSDAHLREILKLYSQAYKTNFARDALHKSTNLVGELLAHILNGVINKPVRDALLLHHALTASRKDDLRRELLTSRLVRYHWDRQHMEAVKRAYQQRYGRELQDAIKDATSGEWGLFCRELCITRMPNDVRRVERLTVEKPDRSRSKDRSRDRSNTLDVAKPERGKSRERSRDRSRDRRRD